MRNYLRKQNSVKFHPEQIRNDRALGFFEEVAPTRTTKINTDAKDR